MKRGGLLAVVAGGVMMTGTAVAEPVEERAARKMLFSPQGGDGDGTRRDRGPVG